MPGPMRLVALGDSVTVGGGFSGVTHDDCWAALVQRRLDAASADVEIVKSALEGMDTGYAIKRFARLVTAHEPDVVFVMLGLNDAQPPGVRAATSPEDYRQNLLGLVDRVLTIDARPILACSNPRFSLADSRLGEPCVDLMRAYVSIVREVAEHFHLSCVDVFGRFVATGGLRALIPDGIHPGPSGHAIIADAISSVVLPLFGVRFESTFVAPAASASPAAYDAAPAPR